MHVRSWRNASEIDCSSPPVYANRMPLGLQRKSHTADRPERCSVTPNRLASVREVREQIDPALREFDECNARSVRAPSESFDAEAVAAANSVIARAICRADVQAVRFLVRLVGDPASIRAPRHLARLDVCSVSEVAVYALLVTAIGGASGEASCGEDSSFRST